MTYEEVKEIKEAYQEGYKEGRENSSSILG